MCQYSLQVSLNVLSLSTFHCLMCCDLKVIQKYSQLHTHTLMRNTHAHARTHARTHTHMRNTHAHARTHTHTCATPMHMHAHTHIHTHASTHARTHTHTHTQCGWLALHCTDINVLAEGLKSSPGAIRNNTANHH